MLDVVDENLQCFAVDGLDDVRVRFVQLQDPLQDLVLVHEVAVVDGAELVAVERERWQIGQIVFLVDAIVGSFDEVDALLLAFVVDVFKFIQDLLRLLVALAVCNMCM